MAKKAAATKSTIKQKDKGGKKPPGSDKGGGGGRPADTVNVDITNYLLVLNNRKKQGNDSRMNDDVRNFVFLKAPAGYKFQTPAERNKVKHVRGSTHRWKAKAVMNSVPADGSSLVIVLNATGPRIARSGRSSAPGFWGADSLDLTVTVPPNSGTTDPTVIMSVQISAWAGDYDPVGDFAGDP